MRLKYIIITVLFLSLGIGAVSHAGVDDACSFYREIGEQAEIKRSVGTELQRQKYSIEEYKKFIVESIKKSGEHHYHCANGAGCFLMSRKLLAKLAGNARFNPQQAMVSGAIELHLNNIEIPSISYHFFLVDTKLGSEFEIIIDPTFHQFFHDPDSLNLPSVFVGTKEDLVDLFRRNQAHIKPMHDSILKHHKRTVPKNEEELAAFENPVWDPEEFVELTWGFGRGKDLREIFPPGTELVFEDLL